MAASTQVSFASSAESARAAWEAARPRWRALREAVERDGTALVPETVAHARDAAAPVLRALVAGDEGSDVRALVAALRQQGLCTLDEAHALVDFEAFARQLAEAPEVVRHASEATRQVIGRAAQALERLVRTADGAAAAAPLTMEYTQAARAAATSPSAAGSSPPSPPQFQAPSPSLAPLPESAAAGRSRSSIFVVGLVVVCLAAASIAALLFAGVGRRDPLREGIAAYEAGQRMVARLAFERAAAQDPSDARPLVFLGRLAREEGDVPLARRLLEQAVQRDPDAALAHRELASALLADGQPELARRFYVRALTLDPQDRVAQGFLGCALARLGRADEAARWAERAGPGDWSRCIGEPRGAPTVPPMSPAP